MSAQYVIEPLPGSTTANVREVVRILLARWPTPELGGDVDETPWTSDPEWYPTGSVALDVSVSALDEVVPVIFAVTRENGCRVFDPQIGEYWSV